MNKNFNNWTMAVLVLAVAVLVIGAIGTSVTGNGIFDWMKKSTQVQETTQPEIYNGLLAESYLEAGMSSEDLKSYEVKYDENGDMVYEMRIFEGKKTLFVGEDYVVQDEEDEGIRVVDFEDGEIILATTDCFGCNVPGCKKWAGQCNGVPCYFCSGGCDACDMYLKSAEKPEI